MPLTIDIRKSGLYQEGYAAGYAEEVAKWKAEGKAEGKAEVAQRMLKAESFSQEDIMDLLHLSLQEYETIRENIEH